MALLLGIDTGGTYTDAVLFDEDRGVLCAAKALTTRHDFSVGIGRAVARVIEEGAIAPEDIALVSLSTTLATNALVEGQGGRVCLVLIGFNESALARNGLKEALDGDPVIILNGGHNGQGEEAAPLDEAALEAALEGMEGTVGAFAVGGLFAIRNPAHELRAAEIIRAKTGASVTCSHELSSKLDGPRRALTSVLNARLIDLLHHLVTSTEELFTRIGIDAPLMVVQGDGALISAEVAKLKPIETILSGPAASIVGAGWLSGTGDGLVSDIGGTTTDIALLEGGRPRLDADGATVGGWRTMVEAVAIHTVGLGGDSELHVTEDGLRFALRLGPRRLMPVSLLAAEHPEFVHKVLDIQLGAERGQALDGRFAVATGRSGAALSGLGELEREMLAALEEGPKPLDKFLARRKHHGALDRLVNRGLVLKSGFTPSDAAHVLGLHSAWDKVAAEKAAALVARLRDRRGDAFAASPKEVAKRTIERLVRQSAETLLVAAIGDDPVLPASLAATLLDAANRETSHPLVETGLSLRLPVIGLGASAHIYYPDIAKRLGTTAIVPEHAGVANAIGAVVGQVRVTADATILPTPDDTFRFYHAGAPRDFPTLEAAVAEAEKVLTAEGMEKAAEAGARDIKTRFHRKDNVARIEGRDLLIESALRITAYGRPRLVR